MATSALAWIISDNRSDALEADKHYAQHTMHLKRMLASPHIPVGRFVVACDHVLTKCVHSYSLALVDESPICIVRAGFACDLNRIFLDSRDESIKVVQTCEISSNGTFENISLRWDAGK